MSTGEVGEARSGRCLLKHMSPSPCYLCGRGRGPPQRILKTSHEDIRLEEGLAHFPSSGTCKQCGATVHRQKRKEAVVFWAAESDTSKRVWQTPRQVPSHIRCHLMHTTMPTDLPLRLVNSSPPQEEEETAIA